MSFESDLEVSARTQALNKGLNIYCYEACPSEPACELRRSLKQDKERLNVFLNATGNKGLSRKLIRGIEYFSQPSTETMARIDKFAEYAEGCNGLTTIKPGMGNDIPWGEIEWACGSHATTNLLNPTKEETVYG